jgi:hypothetical protein
MKPNGQYDTFDVLERVLLERGRQEVKWGEQNHDPLGYLAILVEEVGEVAKEACALVNPAGVFNSDAYITELLHVSAVAVAMIECELRRRDA